MESKEALEKIKDFVKENTNINTWDNPISDIDDCYDIIEKDLEILDQYKATDEELGLEYPVFLKAAKYGFYIKNDNGTIGFVQGGDLHLAKLLELKKFIMRGTGEDVYFSSYGSKWALTMKELKNDK